MHSLVIVPVRHSSVRGAPRDFPASTSSRSKSSVRPTRSGTLSAARGVRVMAAASAKDTCRRNLLVVGPGVLGSLVCQRWLHMYPAAIIKGQTNTTDSHERLMSLGISPRVKSEASPSEKFPFVVFSAPPSGSEDYTGEIKAALKQWDGTGGFVFTSSTAVYAGTDGETCDETTPEYAVGENPRADRLLQAEAAVLEAGGCVVRLSGLYHSTRGAHMYFLKTPTIKSSPDGIVNLVHYEDAAAAVVDALGAQLDGTSEGGEVFLATDGAPITRKDMVEACLESVAYDEGAMPEFSGDDVATGKSMTNPKTRERLGWKPTHSSFAEFVSGGAVDSFSDKKIKFV